MSVSESSPGTAGSPLGLREGGRHVVHLPRISPAQRRAGTGGPRPARAARHVRLPGALGRSDAAPRRSRTGASRSRARSTSRCTWSWDEFQALPREHVTKDIHCVTTWSKLDTNWEGVSVDTLLDGVETTAEFVVAYCDGGYTTNLPLEDVTGGKAWVAFGYRRRAARARARRARAAAGAAPVLLEEREVGARAAPGAARTSPASGRATATTTTATHGSSSATAATDLAGRRGRRVDRGDAARAQHRPRRAGLAGSPGRPARRRPAHGRGRLPGAAQLLDRVRAGRRRARRSPSSGWRRARCRRTSSTSCGPATSSSCAGRSAATSSGTPPCGGPLLLVGGGSGIVPLMAILRQRVADRQRRRGAPARVVAHSGRHHLRGRARAARRARRGRDRAHPDPRDARRLERPPRPHRRGDADARSPGRRRRRRSRFVCGPTGLVEAVATALVELGHAPERRSRPSASDQQEAEMDVERYWTGTCSQESSASFSSTS